MRLLIDRQIFIWAVMDSEKLNTQTRQIMLDASVVFVWGASIWEVSIKAKLGRLEGNTKEYVAAIDQSGFRKLFISARHATAVYELPFQHRDPFDRLLIAQALTEPLRLLTADSMHMVNNVPTILHIPRPILHSP